MPIPDTHILIRYGGDIYCKKFIWNDNWYLTVPESRMEIANCEICIHEYLQAS